MSGVPLVPGTALLELALEAGRRARTPFVTEFTLEEPMALPSGEGLRLQLTLQAPGADGERPFALYSKTDAEDEPWTRHGVGTLAASAPPPRPEFDELRCWPVAGTEPRDLSGFYEGLAARGLCYGPASAVSSSCAAIRAGPPRCSAASCSRHPRRRAAPWASIPRSSMLRCTPSWA